MLEDIGGANKKDIKHYLQDVGAEGDQELDLAAVSQHCKFFRTHRTYTAEQTRLSIEASSSGLRTTIRDSMKQLEIFCKLGSAPSSGLEQHLQAYLKELEKLDE